MSGPVAIAALDGPGLERRLDALAGLLAACVNDGAGVGFVRPFGAEAARAFWRDRVAPAVAAGTRVLLIATAGGAVAGTVQLNLDTMPNQPHRADVAKLLVDPGCRRRGIGRALMRAVEAEADAAGRRLLTLDTASDAAFRLYRSLGYEPAGAIPDYALDASGERFEATTILYKRLIAGTARLAPEA